jgi:hypothetical protein
MENIKNKEGRNLGNDKDYNCFCASKLAGKNFRSKFFLNGCF